MKKFIITFTVLAIISLISGCDTQEFYQKESTYKSTAKYISFKEFKNKRLATEKFNEIEQKNKTSIYSKHIYSAEYDFIIDTEQIFYFQYEDYSSFTFKIYKADELDKIENLIIVEKGESVSAYVAKYALNDEEINKIMQNHIVDLSGKLEVKPLLQTDGCWYKTHIESVIGSDGQIYATVQWWHNSCTGEDMAVPSTIVGPSGPGGGDSSTGAENGPPGPSLASILYGVGWFASWTGNTTIVVGGGVTAGNTSNPDGSEGPSLFGDNSVVTHPVIPSNDQVEEELKKLTEITNDSSKPYKAKITELQESFPLDHERGFTFSIDSLGTVTSVEMPYTPTGVHFTIPSSEEVVRAHDHHNGLDAVFSEDDVKGMAEFYAVKEDYGDENAEEVISILISRTGAFALTVDDPLAVSVFLDDFKNGMVDINGKSIPFKTLYYQSYNKDVIVKSKIQSNNVPEQYDIYVVENFLLWLQSMNTGLGYYIGTPNGDGTYTWTRVN